VRGLYVLRQKAVYGLATLAVVIVGRVDVGAAHVVWRAVEFVDTPDGRELFGGSMTGPIVRGGDQQHGPGGDHGGDLHVAGVQAEARGPFPGVATLHMGGDQLYRCPKTDPIADGTHTAKF